MSVNAAPDADPFDATVRMTRNDARHRYELFAEDTLAAIITFRELPGHVELIHTVAQPGFDGRGLAKVLVRYALDDVVAAGKRIIPQCSYVKRFLQAHPEPYAQYTDAPEQA